VTSRSAVRLALLLLAAGGGAAVALPQDAPPPPPAPGPAAPGKAPAPPPKPPPVDEGLPPEAQIRREIGAEPRNRKRDAFPVIRDPRYLRALEAPRMDPAEWVIGTVVGTTPLAYPVNLLNHHEIVVDQRDGVPFVVAWCPLCRTGTVHSRSLAGQILDFGHSGMLYRSAFLLYDKSTDSLWHNASGRALAGRLRGRQLPRLPSWFTTWEVWRTTHPSTLVLAKDPSEPGHQRDAYRERNATLKLAHGLGVEVNGQARLYEFSELERMPLVLERVGGVPVVVVYDLASKTATAWDRTVDGRVLDLRRAEDAGDARIRLEETGQDRSVFDAVTGEALTGPLAGKRLGHLPATHWEVHAWMAHHPRGSTFRAAVPPPPDLPPPPAPGK
jgi:hypothetical protein